MTHRVVVTGFGAIAPNGLGAEAFWEATCAATLLQAGGEIMVMRHPDAVKSFKALVSALSS